MDQTTPQQPDTGGHVAAGLAEVRDLDTSQVLARVVAERAAADRHEARLLALAVHYVDLHPVTDVHPSATGQPTCSDPVLTALPSHRRSAADSHEFACDTREVALAGAGTPGIAAYAVEELGAVLHVPYVSALSLVAEAVEVCFRLPRLWGLVQAGSVPSWRARQAARLTTMLSQAAVDFVDAQIAILAARGRMPGLGRLRDLVHEAQLRLDPDHEQAVEEAALQARGVWFDHHTSTASAAVTTMTARLDSWDALDLDATVSDLANLMGRLGDPSSLDVRRATALGTLADPQRALDLTAGAGSEAADRPQRRATTPGSRIQLYAHATLADLAELASRTDPLKSSGGLGSIETLGSASLSVLERWLGRTSAVTVRPVLDPTDPDTAATRPVDRHDPPDAMRELVILRDGTCVFPGCTTDARRCDLDHIEPYVALDVGGPPGQTRPENLACTCRRHHRLKTHTAWSYERLPDGRYQWTSPRGQTFITSPLPKRAGHCDEAA